MKRIDGEDFNDYKERRTEENKRIKKKLKGTLMWSSKNISNKDPLLNKGTYINPERKKKKEKRELSID